MNKKNTINAISYIREFGLVLFIIKALRRLTLKSDSAFSYKINECNEKLVERTLVNITDKVDGQIDVKKMLVKKHNSMLHAPIWVMWYQGMENALDIVRCCMNSIKENRGGHKVIVLSEENLRDYIELPEFIWKKFHAGQISKTHLSDMIRLNILYLYGGAWIDATVLCTEKIPEGYFGKEIFSINFGIETKDPSHGKWTTFCLFARKNNQFILDILEMHYKYWYKKDSAVDYVMFDYFMKWLCEKNEDYNRMVSKIEPTNRGVFLLAQRMNQPCKEGLIPLEKGTIFYKLSWKRRYLGNINGIPTVYSRILDKYNI